MKRVNGILLLFSFFFLTVVALAQKVPDIRTLFAELNQPASTDRATRQIPEIAGKDPAARNYVIERLPRMIDKPEEDEIWMNAVRLAGRLKGAEAIPALRSALARGKVGAPMATTFGTQMRLDDDVVGKALSEIGDPSIPAISPLLGSKDMQTRRRVVLILRNIDSPDARRTLEKQLTREDNPKIKRLIENGLHS